MPISFGFDVPNVTRASGADAATKLGNYFIVYGEKGETNKNKYGDGNQVFPNYTVHYTTNTAYTTTSNTKNWEYVAVTPISTTNVKMSDGTTVTTAPSEQTIKYWDYGAASYTFTAVSAKQDDIANGRVTIQKNTVGESDVYDKGYTITLAKTTSPETYPTLSDIYISDRMVINQGVGSDRNAENAYGGNVTLTFRNLLSQVRAGVYETIPGYDITSIKFYVTSDAEAKVSTTSAFGAICPNVTIGGGFEGTLNVTYYDNTGSAENQPKVAVSGGSGSASDLILGTNMSTLNNTDPENPLVLGKTAAAPTWDTADGDYTNVLPQSVDNTTNLKLKCDYTLWNNITGETIEVKGATAEIPSQYLQWKSNFKYTYLFKISDNPNGQTGTGDTPAGLYPITFDAIEMVNGDGMAEYITTVSEPSITTFGAVYNTTSNKHTAYQTGNNEYQAQTSPNQLDIFVTFMEGSTVKSPTLGTSGAQHVNVFKVTTTDATNFPITEASVAEAIANPAMSVDIYTRTGESSSYTYTKVTDATTIAAGTTYYKADGSDITPGADGYSETEAVAGTDYIVGAKLNVTNVTSDAATNFSAIPAVVANVPAEDGTTKTINALKLTGVKAGTYAIEYEASSAWTGSYTKVYKVINVTAAP